MFKYQKQNSQKGQLILEILIIISIVAVIVGLGAQFIYLSLRSSKVSAEKNVALGLQEETFEAVRAATTEKWQNLYNLTHVSNYWPDLSTGKWVINNAGTQSVTINGIGFTRSFQVQHVCRDDFTRHITVISDNSGGDLFCTGAPIDDSLDPSTEKISVTVSWPNADALTASEYLTRWRNKVCNQTSWSTTTGGEGLIACTGSGVYSSSTNIDFSPNTELELVTPLPASGELTSAVFDMINTNGGTLNAVSWTVTVPNPVGTKVRFQFATADADTGPWTFKGGSTCGISDWYESTTTDTSVEIKCPDHSNKRYYRYKIQLCSTNTCTAPAGTGNPKVEDINVSWSP